MRNVFLEEDLEDIEENAFQNNINLNTVVLPHSVKNYSKNAFPPSVTVIYPTPAPEIVTREFVRGQLA